MSCLTLTEQFIQALSVFAPVQWSTLNRQLTSQVVIAVIVKIKSRCLPSMQVKSLHVAAVFIPGEIHSLI